MNRKLYYRGKTLKEMTVNELNKQYKMNQIRFVYRSVFFICITILIAISEPIVSSIPVIIAVITGYWLIQNNRNIKNEIENR